MPSTSPFIVSMPFRRSAPHTILDGPVFLSTQGAAASITAVARFRHSMNPLDIPAMILGSRVIEPPWKRKVVSYDPSPLGYLGRSLVFGCQLSEAMPFNMLLHLPPQGFFSEHAGLAS